MNVHAIFSVVVPGIFGKRAELTLPSFGPLIALAFLTSCAQAPTNVSPQPTTGSVVKTLSAEEITRRLNAHPKPEGLVCKINCYVRLCNMPPKSNPIDCGLICEEVCQCKPGSPC